MYALKSNLMLTILLLALASCQPHSKQDTVAHETTGASAPRIMQINEPCAVFYSPDSAKLDKLKKENGEETLTTLHENNMIFMDDARTFFEGKGIKIIEAPGSVVNFHLQGGKSTSIDLNDNKYTWTILLFDGREVHPIDLTDIEGEWKKYKF
ncbi:MAG TPA: hypothetical protein VM802_12160 [Chitinophaga sp.]|uniref:hypothetical protein n=1 Tax=Chitinophaga sp. TaxID=1869181 RepID=UPI002C1A1C2E|nr:hypothetical protein [Chitinophaga sp.]HVI45621.1 hypothetical protein [Chitinophaga sp.]